jgi:hypothetical protein
MISTTTLAQVRGKREKERDVPMTPSFPVSGPVVMRTARPTSTNVLKAMRTGLVMLNLMLNDLHQLGSHEDSSPKKTHLRNFIITFPRSPWQHFHRQSLSMSQPLRRRNIVNFFNIVGLYVERNFSSKINSSSSSDFNVNTYTMITR